MHIEPGLVADNKIWLSYVTAAGACGYTLKSAYQAARQRGLDSTLTRSAVVTGLVLSFFEVLPHYPVGVSEVHLIFGSTLFLVFGAAPAGIGLALGLMIQGLFFAPFDLPQYGMNVTTLLVPLFALEAIARHIIDLHHGDIRAESEGLGKGARFTVTLPVIGQSQVIASGDQMISARM